MEFNKRAVDGEPLAAHSQAKEDLGVPGVKRRVRAAGVHCCRAHGLQFPVLPGVAGSG
jgi:hypothetical protein